MWPLVQFSRSVVSDSLWPHEPQHARPPCPSPTPGVYSNSRPLSQWYHPIMSSSVIPFSSCPQSFPASGSFLMSQLFSSGGQSIGVSVSASGLPMNTQDWFPLGWTGQISLQSKGLSRVFFNTTVENINSLALSFLYSQTLTPTHDYWKNRSLDETDLCWQSNVSAFNVAIVHKYDILTLLSALTCHLHCGFQGVEIRNVSAQLCLTLFWPCRL